MLGALGALPAGSVVLLHACAHNPTGVDPTAAQWALIAQTVQRRKLVPLVDAAYQVRCPPLNAPRQSADGQSLPVAPLHRASRPATWMPTPWASARSPPCRASR